jgi:hypothetical protein
VLLLGRKFPFDISQPHFSTPRIYDEQKELHRHVHIGRDMLASLILAISSEENASQFFPKIDMSIWAEDDAAAKD